MIYGQYLKDKIIDNLNSDTGSLKCPVCGHGCVHVSAESLSPEATGTRQGGYVVILSGECGHQWGEAYAEHKGQTVKLPILFQAAPMPEIVSVITETLDEQESRICKNPRRKGNG